MCVCVCWGGGADLSPGTVQTEASYFKIGNISVCVKKKYKPECFLISTLSLNTALSLSSKIATYRKNVELCDDPLIAEEMD